MDRQPSGPSCSSSSGNSSTGLTRWPTTSSTSKVNTRRPDPELRRGEAGAALLMHRVGEVGDQLAQLLVEVDDRIGRRAQHGVAEETDGLDGHAGWLLRWDELCRTSLRSARLETGRPASVPTSVCPASPGGSPGQQVAHPLGVGVAEVVEDAPGPAARRGAAGRVAGGVVGVAEPGEGVGFVVAVAELAVQRRGRAGSRWTPRAWSAEVVVGVAEAVPGVGLAVRSPSSCEQGERLAGSARGPARGRRAGRGTSRPR